MSPEALYVEVAVPVPLRRTFTYGVPPELRGRVEPGSRVAVPFGRRKLPGFVLGLQAVPPEGARMRNVAGVLDATPLFGPELLAFLREAADYYLHPIGEVCRAAAPALPSEAMKSLRQKGFLAEGENLPGSRLPTRTTLLARLRGGVDMGRLGKSQRQLVQLLEERGEITLDELRLHIKNPRSVLRTLEKRELVDLEQREVPRDRFFASPVEPEAAPTPNDEQAHAVASMTGCLGTGGGFLLHGVTGSGKTEVYLRVIAEARARDMGALMLVPEIALTPQLVSRFRARFGDAIAVLHSELSDRERNDAWRSLREGRLRVAIGARSALYAPIRKLGVVVVDEEHDGSFKQEEGFRYHARDMALLRAHRAGAVCILGSATPSLESWQLAEGSKLERITLSKRATGQELPPVELVDLARHRSGPSSFRLLTGPLHRALQECLDRDEQAILFLNRRGFSPTLRCGDCGEVAECPACSVSLTEHRRAGLLRCHYCDFSRPLGGACSACGHPKLEELGVGTENLEESLRGIFPTARVARLDRDTASGRGVEDVMARLRAGEIDILVGTQMVTKGHDIPGVTLVGVILADQSLAFPDFRAPERTFQLLAQVAGRAGRGALAGRVILQTYQPQHHAVRFACSHDYLGFVRAELPDREELGYPPHSRMTAVRVDAADEAACRSLAAELANIARSHPAVTEGKVEVMGPAAAPIARIRGRYRYRFMLRSPDRPGLRSVALGLARRIDDGVAPARVSIDVDPVSML